MAESLPLHVVTACIGHSQLVARKHYRQATDEQFARAAQNAAHLAQKEVQQASAAGCMERQENRTEGPKNVDSLISMGAEALTV